MPRHPVDGIRGSKPRLAGVKSAQATGKASKKAEISTLNREYLKTRNAQMHTKMLSAQMNFARERGELISKRLAEFQLSYLLIALRRQLLSLPNACAQQLAGLTDAHEIKIVLEGAVHALLEELQDLPSKVVDPHWEIIYESRFRRLLEQFCKQGGDSR